MRGYRTYLVAAATVVLAGLEGFDVTNFVTPGNEGIALAVLGVAIAVLRKVTNTPAAV